MILLLKDTKPEQINIHLSELYGRIVKIHNQQNELPNLDNYVKNFNGRPYSVIDAESISEKIKDSIENKDFHTIKVERVGLDIKIDSVDFTEQPELTTFM